ncbi:MAG TPA: response regulator transcription factor [Candidatus Polarisedimenticolaceae bacterium]|nr:response regulator transcription factor [Candidatus Polarisedimenticolaceae bacterium]
MNTAGKIRVVLADDHTMVREALAGILDQHDEIEVVGQASDGSEAVALVERLGPQVLVLDYSMPGNDAPKVIEALARAGLEVKILILTVHENIHYAVRVLESGALGYVVKTAAAQELVEAIRAVERGEVYISRAVSQRVLQQLRRPRTDRLGVGALSQREFELLRVLGAGLSLKECAEALNISTSTASTYRARLMQKLGLRTTAEIIRFALEHDVIG